MDSIEGEIFDRADREISSNQIGEIVMEHLQALDAVAYVRFASVYREFKDVSTFMEELKNLWNHNPQEIKIPLNRPGFIALSV